MLNLFASTRLALLLIDHGHRFRRVVGTWFICFSGPRSVRLSWHWGTLSVTGTLARDEFATQWLPH